MKKLIFDDFQPDGGRRYIEVDDEIIRPISAPPLPTEPAISLSSPAAEQQLSSDAGNTSAEPKIAAQIEPIIEPASVNPEPAPIVEEVQASQDSHASFEIGELIAEAIPEIAAEPEHEIIADAPVELWAGQPVEISSVAEIEFSPVPTYEPEYEIESFSSILPDEEFIYPVIHFDFRSEKSETVVAEVPEEYHPEEHNVEMASESFSETLDEPMAEAEQVPEVSAEPLREDLSVVSPVVSPVVSIEVAGEDSFEMTVGTAPEFVVEFEEEAEIAMEAVAEAPMAMASSGVLQASAVPEQGQGSNLPPWKAPLWKTSTGKTVGGKTPGSESSGSGNISSTGSSTSKIGPADFVPAKPTVPMPALTNFSLTRPEARPIAHEFHVTDFFDLDSPMLKSDAEPRAEFDFLLGKVLNLIKDVTFAHTVAFFWANRDKGQLVAEAHITECNAFIRRKRFSFGHDLVSKVAETGKPEVLTDVNPVSEAELLPYYDAPAQIKSFAGVPVFFCNSISSTVTQPVAVIVVDSVVDGSFGPETLLLLGQFTKLVSGLIKSYTQKYDLLLDAELLASLQRMQDKLKDDFSVNTITHLLAEETCKLVNLD